MRNSFAKVLTEGLLKGYAGGSKISPIKRGAIFNGNASSVTFSDGQRYHDEWFASNQGGGQELVKVGDETFTRLYAGGCPDNDELKKIGVTKQQVNDYLRGSIVRLQGSTRLFKDCMDQPQNEWQYIYKITQTYPFAFLICW